MKIKKISTSYKSSPTGENIYKIGEIITEDDILFIIINGVYQPSFNYQIVYSKHYCLGFETHIIFKTAIEIGDILEIVYIQPSFISRIFRSFINLINN